MVLENFPTAGSFMNSQISAMTAMTCNRNSAGRHCAVSCSVFRQGLRRLWDEFQCSVDVPTESSPLRHARRHPHHDVLGSWRRAHEQSVTDNAVLIRDTTGVLV